MMNFGWIVGGIGGVISAAFLGHFDPNASPLAIFAFSLIGGLISIGLWLNFVNWLNIPEVPVPTREELQEAFRVDLLRRIAEATEACGSAKASSVTELQFMLDTYDYACKRMAENFV